MSTHQSRPPRRWPSSRGMRRRGTSRRTSRLVSGGLAVVLLALGLSTVHVSGSPAAKPLTPVTRTPIKHVVIIYQENHSFDDALGAVCQHRAVSCDGYTGPVTFRDHQTAKNIVEPDVVPVMDHLPRSQFLGLANRWDKIAGCTGRRHLCVTHYRAGGIPNLAALARRFVVSDRSFASDKTASFGAHVTLAAGTIDGFVGTNPHAARGVKPGVGWGCSSNKLVLWARPHGPQTLVPSCIPDSSGQGPFRTSPVRYAPTIMQRLEEKGLRWHIYQGHRTDRPTQQVWAVCDYFFWCRKNRFDLKHDSSTTSFIDTARAGHLPALSILLPLQGYSQHNQASMKIGDNYIGRVVRSAERGPQWRSTAIFITYDDCGCFYDHVKPPAPLGIRAPMVIISPWAKPGQTDSHTAVVPYSMLAFVQWNFRLSHLTDAVDNVYDYRRSFDFNGPPHLKQAHMTISHVPKRELAYIAAHPADPDDPT
jgi:phospholipase C